MSNEHGPVQTDPELNAVAVALGSLEPARSRLDRDRVMFRAGQASRPTPRRRRFWPVATSCLALIAAAEAALLAYRPAPRVDERIVVVRESARVAPAPESGEVDQPPEPSSPVLAGDGPALGQSARERLAGQVLRYGLDGLPASPSARWADADSYPSPSRPLLQEQLRKALDHGDAS